MTAVELNEIIQEKFNINTVPPMFTRQISRFILENGMTYKEIARCVVYYTEVKGQTVDTTYGLFFVLNVREETERYFTKLALELEKQKKEAKKVIENQGNNIIFNTSRVRQPKRKRPHLDLSKIDISEDTEGDNN